MRDLQADLQICNKATLGPWIRSKFGLNILTHDSEISTATQKYSGTSSYAEEQIKKLEANANFIAEAREGWPEAIERAIKAEEQVVKLQLTLQEIANPIKFLKQRADEQGTELNGLLAINLATDAGYIKGIAKKALAEQEV